VIDCSEKENGKYNITNRCYVVL